MLLAIYERNSMKTIVKTEMLIYQSKANFNEKVLFVKISPFNDPEIRKIRVRGMFGNNIACRN